MSNELKDILIDEDHPHFENCHEILNTIFYFLYKEFNKTEYLNAIKNMENTIPLFIEMTEEDSEEEVYIEQQFINAVHDDELWEMISELYYTKLIYGDPMLKAIFPYNFATPIPIFLEKLETEYKRVLKLVETDDNPKLGKYVLNSRYQYLQSPKVIVDLQRKYIKERMNADFRKSMSSFLKGFSKEDFSNALDEIYDGEMDIKLKTELLYFFTHPKVKKKHIEILRREEELGFLAYQEYVEHCKKILFKRIETIISVCKFFKTTKEFKQGPAFVEEITRIGPYNIHLLYDEIHLQCLSEIGIFYSDAICSSFAMKNNALPVFEETIDKILVKNLNPMTLKIKEYYSNYITKFEELAGNGSEVRNALQENRDQDLIRGAISSLSPILLVKNIFRIYKEEDQASRFFKKTNQAISDLYLQYFNSLEQLEKYLLQFYENLYHEIYMNVFLPYVKKIFKSYEPVRKNGGYYQYQSLLFETVTVFRENNKHLKIKRFEDFFSDYIRDEYFTEKTLTFG